MPKAIETILKTVGLPDEDVAKITALKEEEEKEFDATPYVEKVKSNYQTQFKNDPNFFNDITIENLPPAVKKTIESGQYARATNVAKDKLAKSLGFKESEIEDLQAEDYKPLDAFVKAIADKYTKTKTGDKELQQQLIEERKEKEELKKRYGPDYEKEVETKHETKAEQKITQAIFNANVISELSGIPGLKVKASTLAREANEKLQSKYGLERVGDFSVELRQKSNPSMKVLKNGSSQELTLREALAEIADQEGWIEKPQVSTSGSGTVAVVPSNGHLEMKDVVSPHVQDRVSKKIASEK